jgi:dihydroorotate dehydrogenase electron transfer subunit
MAAREFTGIVTAAEPVNEDSIILTFTCPEGVAAGARAGRFVQILCRDPLSFDPLLRRPFSLTAASSKENTLSIMIRPFGRASAWLTERVPGDRLDVVGLLGNIFTIAPTTMNVLLVAGGIGAAPLLMLAEEATALGKNITFLMGAASDRELLPPSIIPSSAEFHVATIDGTGGHLGFVTDLVPEFARWADQVFACGPEAMFYSLRTSLAPHRIGGRPAAQVSIDRTMACGFGACLSCVVETRHGLAISCVDGPVFNLDDLVW